MLRDLYDGSYDPMYFRIETKAEVDSIFNNLKKKLASDKKNQEVILPGVISAEAASKTEAFIRMQRDSDSAVPYTPDNQIWNDYIEAFWGDVFSGYAFKSNFYKREFLKDKELLLALAEFYKEPDDEKLNILMTLLEKKQITVGPYYLIFSVHKEFYMPLSEFIIKHLDKYFSMVTRKKLDAPYQSSKGRIDYQMKKKAYILKLLEMYDIIPGSYEEEQKASYFLGECIRDHYDSDEYQNELEGLLIRNQAICDALDN